MKNNISLPIALLITALSLSACGTAEKDRLDANDKSDDCSISKTANGSFEITCPDGSKDVIENGKDGKPGQDGVDGDDAPNNACTLIDTTDGIHTMDCGNGPIVLGNNCPDGYPGDVYISGDSSPGSQSALASIKLFGCTKIQGDLIIEHIGSDQPFTLDPALAKITEIDGSLRLYNSYSLAKFDLPALKSVGGNIEFGDHYILDTISFASLESIGGSLHLGELTYDLSSYYGGNENLQTLNFPELTEIGENFNISSNPRLESLEGLPKLLTIGGNLTIINNTELTNISGIRNVTEIAGYVFIDANQTLLQCEAREQIQKLPGFTPADEPDSEKLTIEPNRPCP